MTKYGKKEINLDNILSDDDGDECTTFGRSHQRSPLHVQHDHLRSLCWAFYFLLSIAGVLRLYFRTIFSYKQAASDHSQKKMCCASE